MTTPFVIAEAGVNHGGSIDRAYDLVEAAHRAGADAVKFQTFLAERLVRKSDPDFGLLSQLALRPEAFAKIAAHAEAVGIQFMSTPGDAESLLFLVNECRMRTIKIGSDDLTNLPLLAAAYATRRPIFLSTGMATMREIVEALPADGSGDITLLHCVSLYPCPSRLANLRAIEALAALGRAVGYSDHTVGVLASVLAAALGAEVIEKHIKLLGSDPVDNAVSIDPHYFASMVRELRQIEELMGDGSKNLSPEEAEAAQRFRKGEDGLRGAA